MRAGTTALLMYGAFDTKLVMSAWISNGFLALLCSLFGLRGLICALFVRYNCFPFRVYLHLLCTVQRAKPLESFDFATLPLH